METVGVQKHTSLNSARDNVERSTVHRMEPIELQLYTFLTLNRYC